VTGDPLQAALFYVLLGKARLLATLFRSANNAKMAEFFAHDFAEARWSTAALKNAFVLVSKQRFVEAVAFFLLGGDADGAISVCLRNLNDPQLAYVISRLAHGEDSAACSGSPVTW
jgi:hypothetical protein